MFYSQPDGNWGWPANWYLDPNSYLNIHRRKFHTDDGHADRNKLSVPSVSCTGNEESSKLKKDPDLFKLYGCGICCQSFSTKEETMHCFNSH